MGSTVTNNKRVVISQPNRRYRRRIRDKSLWSGSIAILGAKWSRSNRFWPSEFIKAQEHHSARLSIIIYKYKHFIFKITLYQWARNKLQNMQAPCSARKLRSTCTNLDQWNFCGTKQLRVLDMRFEPSVSSTARIIDNILKIWVSKGSFALVLHCALSHRLMGKGFQLDRTEWTSASTWNVVIDWRVHLFYKKRFTWGGGKCMLCMF